MKRRQKAKYPNLNRRLNTKRRQDYMDNVDPIDGVYNDEGELVIRAYTDEEKAWLNKFNDEYYNANFDKDDSKNLHKVTASTEIIATIRQNLSQLRARTHDEKCPITLKSLIREIEDLEEYLGKVYPRKGCTDANNARNRCLLNKAKADNSVRILPIENMHDMELKDDEEDIELMYILNNMEEGDSGED